MLTFSFNNLERYPSCRNRRLSLRLCLWAPDLLYSLPVVLDAGLRTTVRYRSIQRHRTIRRRCLLSALQVCPEAASLGLLMDTLGQ